MTVFWPIFAVQTSYLSVVGASNTKAYSCPGARKIGVGNNISVATSPLSEVWISSGSNSTESPIAIRVGVPNSIVLTWTMSGWLPFGLLATNISAFVKKTPRSSSLKPSAFGACISAPTLNDCARGSVLFTIAASSVVVVVVVVSLVIVSKFTVVTVVVIVVSFCCSMKVPRAVYVPLAEEINVLPGRGLLFSLLLVIVNVFAPVNILGSGMGVEYGSLIKKHPLTVPWLSETSFNSFTKACAELDCPTNCAPFLRYP